MGFIIVLVYTVGVSDRCLRKWEDTIYLITFKWGTYNTWTKSVRHPQSWSCPIENVVFKSAQGTNSNKVSSL